MSFELRTGTFSAFIDRLTPTTHIMIVLADPNVGNFPRFPNVVCQVDGCLESAAVMMNIAVARKHFEKLEKWDRPESTEKSKRNGVTKVKANFC